MVDQLRASILSLQGIMIAVSSFTLVEISVLPMKLIGAKVEGFHFENELDLIKRGK